MSDAPMVLDPEAETILVEGAMNVDETLDKENAILSGQPTAIITHPNTGREYRIFPKAQGYFYKIQEASNEYLIALASFEDRSTASRFRKMWKGWWRWRRQTAVDGIEVAKFKLLAMIFEDVYNEDRHSVLTIEEFASMPHDTVVAILGAYRDANNIDDILSKLIEGWSKKKASPEVALVKEAAGLRV
jgi:hypothetical protein